MALEIKQQYLKESRGYAPCWGLGRIAPSNLIKQSKKQQKKDDK